MQDRVLALCLIDFEKLSCHDFYILQTQDARTQHFSSLVTGSLPICYFRV
jgi:hypothetical protein